MKDQIQQIQNEIDRWLDMDEELPFILEFVKKNKIRLFNVAGFVAKWRLNPKRKEINHNRAEAKTEQANKAVAEQYNEALHSAIAEYVDQGGKLPELKKAPRVGLTAAQREQRRQRIQRQLGY